MKAGRNFQGSDSAAPELAACPPPTWGHPQPTQQPGERVPLAKGRRRRGGKNPQYSHKTKHKNQSTGAVNQHRTAHRNLTFLVAPAESKRDKSY